MVIASCGSRCVTLLYGAIQAQDFLGAVRGRRKPPTWRSAARRRRTRPGAPTRGRQSGLPGDSEMVGVEGGADGSQRRPARDKQGGGSRHSRQQFIKLTFDLARSFRTRGARWQPRFGPERPQMTPARPVHPGGARDPAIWQEHRCGTTCLKLRPRNLVIVPKRPRTGRRGGCPRSHDRSPEESAPASPPPPHQSVDPLTALAAAAIDRRLLVGLGVPQAYAARCLVTRTTIGDGQAAL